MALRADLDTSGILLEVERLLGASDWFTSDELQSALDRYRYEHFNTRLIAWSQYDANGPLYKVWNIPSYMEAPVFTDLDHASVSPSTTDQIAGRISFLTSRDNPYLLLSGFEHDIYAAAADLLDARAAKLAGEDKPVTFSGANGSYRAENTPKQLRETAKSYRAKAKVHVGESVEEFQVVTLSRDDIA